MSNLNVILNKEKLIDVLDKNSKCDTCIVQELSKGAVKPQASAEGYKA